MQIQMLAASILWGVDDLQNVWMKNGRKYALCETSNLATGQAIICTGDAEIH